MTIELLKHLERFVPRLDVILVECGPEFHDLGPGPSTVSVMRAGNLGYAGGNNLGIREALRRHADWVIVLNSDAFPLTGSVDELVKAMEAEPKAAVAGASLISLDSKGLIELNNGTCFDWCEGRTYPVAASPGPAPVDFCCGAMLLFRPTALFSVGAFDSALFLFYEEIDWAERARSAGYVVLAVPSAKALHFGSQSVNQAPMATSYYRARNRLIVLRRYGSTHGTSIKLWREVGRVSRALGGLLLRRRWSRVWPLLRGTFDGLTSPLAWSDEPDLALRHQRWEAVDSTLILPRPET